MIVRTRAREKRVRLAMSRMHGRNVSFSTVNPLDPARLPAEPRTRARVILGSLPVPCSDPSEFMGFSEKGRLSRPNQKGECGMAGMLVEGESKGSGDKPQGDQL